MVGVLAELPTFVWEPLAPNVAESPDANEPLVIVALLYVNAVPLYSFDLLPAVIVIGFLLIVTVNEPAVTVTLDKMNAAVEEIKKELGK